MKINKDRLVALTDGIIAIAATIMVLELAVPDSGEWKDLLTKWPTILAYINSFFLIYLVWLSHHNLFNKAENMSRRVFLLNGIWIFFLTLVPFATAWVGKCPHETAPELFYMLLQLCWTISFHVMDVQILKENPGAEKDVSTLPYMRVILYAGLLVGAGATFVKPIVAMAIMLVLVIILAVQLFVGKRKQKSEDTK